MKKIRVTPKRGHASWSFRIFDSSESAYYTRGSVNIDSLGDDISRLIDVGRGDRVEIEWMGSEWVSGLTPDVYDRFDNVRVVKMSKRIGRSGLPEIELYSGWVHPHVLRWTSGSTQNGARIFRLTRKSRSSFDFDDLFSSNDEDQTETREEHFFDVVNLSS